MIITNDREAIQEQVQDIAEAVSHLSILAEIDFEREENRADECLNILPAMQARI